MFTETKGKKGTSSCVRDKENKDGPTRTCYENENGGEGDVPYLDFSELKTDRSKRKVYKMVSL